MAAPGTYKRGLLPAPPHKLLMTVPYRFIRKVKRSAVPPCYATLCRKLSIFLNDTYGDCVTAEECQNINTGTSYVVPDADVKTFGKKYGLLNGADLPQVMDLMADDGLPSGGTTYKDGPYAAVNFQDFEEFCAGLVEFQAIGSQPTQIKLSVSANQMESAMEDGQPFSFFYGFRKDQNTDHCTGAPGFATTAAEGLSLLNAFYGANRVLPSKFDPSAPAIIHYTWGQYQLFEYASLLNVADSAFLRNPSLSSPAPDPMPDPIPGPGPIPGPNPIPGPSPIVAAPTLAQVVNALTPLWQ